MEHLTVKLPDPVIRCMKDHFPNYSIISSKVDTDGKGKRSYCVDILQHDRYCHLQINEEGELIREESEPQFANGGCEQYF